MSIVNATHDDASVAILELFPRQGEWRDGDLVDKRRDYAVAGIAEYWLIDPRNESIQVLHLRDGEYRDVIRAGRTEHAVSRVLPGFRMDVEELFTKARAS